MNRSATAAHSPGRVCSNRCGRGGLVHGQQCGDAIRDSVPGPNSLANPLNSLPVPSSPGSKVRVRKPVETSPRGFTRFTAR